MKTFSKKFKIGTRVRVNGDWRVVSEIHPTRNWVKLEGYSGSYQRGHIEKFSNKDI